MSSLSLFVGLDYHDDEVQACALNEAGEVVLNRKFDNSAATIQAAVNARGQVRRVAIESCCGAANLADELITRGDWPVQLAHPGFVARMKHARDKTDRQDAKVLADLVRVGYLPQVWLAPEEVRQLRRIVRYRQQLVDDRWLLECQCERLAQLDAQIKAVEKRLQARAESDPLIAKLLSLDGVGLITAVTIRAEIGRFDRFQSGKQLARFCGLTPRNASSGQRQADAGLIRAGNPQLRAVQIELAQRLMWRGKSLAPSRWSALGYQLQSRGKPRNVVVAAAMVKAEGARGGCC